MSLTVFSSLVGFEESTLDVGFPDLKDRVRLSASVGRMYETSWHIDRHNRHSLNLFPSAQKITFKSGHLRQFFEIDPGDLTSNSRYADCASHYCTISDINYNLSLSELRDILRTLIPFYLLQTTYSRQEASKSMPTLVVFLDLPRFYI